MRLVRVSGEDFSILTVRPCSALVSVRFGAFAFPAALPQTEDLIAKSPALDASSSHASRRPGKLWMYRWPRAESERAHRRAMSHTR